MMRNIHFNLKKIFIAGCTLLLLWPLGNSAKAATIAAPKDSVSFEKNVYNPIFDTNKLITCYPNPAVSYISFKFDNNVQSTSKLYIYSFTGRKMNEFKITNTLIKISLENYYRGLYVYQLRDADGKILESGKFQVKN